MDITELYSIFLECGKVTTDSRSISGGELFFALKGENFDGNEYAVMALEAGASFAVVDANSAAASENSLVDSVGRCRVIPVDDTLKALQELARCHRLNTYVDGRPVPVVGLTGTNGKTTTKELIRSVLECRYNVTATEGNFNNSIGVPLTLLRINSDTQVAVVEMGANHPDDIMELVAVCLPDCGLITCVGKGHLLGFGDLDGVKRAKGALYDYLESSGGPAFLNIDDKELVGMAEERPAMKVIPYGPKVMGAKVLSPSREKPFLRVVIHDGEEAMNIETHLVGSYNEDNVLAAIAVGEYFGVPVKEAVKAVNSYVPSNNRSQMVRTERNTLIVDAYNANPMSMSAALDSFDSVQSPVKVLCLGNMGELGNESVPEHIKVLKRLENESFDRIILVGEQFRLAMDEMKNGGALGFNPEWFATSEEAAESLQKVPVDGAAVLIKGSRSTRMEMVIPAL
ncbi:MAG: UDP-N-acetylmuramoyl-tripeptide--D-alanyl-D-alanine ligase [Bacteroidales bacterium]|nr:UDP-N-acetylmuramoyl-tripeptide--D-alanyl-D-alanine ligase [Bacteroides sp.]MCM1501156.1 UDP-N-acetylmuramoyl-tripeptide--D-alanyl-D-alanine ligase [Bacteroidales bacterium]